MEVIAIDTDQKIVNDSAVYLPVCKCADVTDAEVISLYKDLGGRLISIGSDAHTPTDIGANYKETEDLLRSLDMNKIAFVQNHSILTYTI